MNIRLAFNTCVIAVRKQSDFFLVAFGAGVSVTLVWLCMSKIGSVSPGLLLGFMILVLFVCMPIAILTGFITASLALAYTFKFLVFLIDKLKQSFTSRQSNTTTTTTTTTTTAGSAGIQMERVRDPNPARTYFKSIPVTTREESESSTNHETITIDPSPPSKRDDDSNQQASVNTPESESNRVQSV
ncbi:hypothetical protein GQ42DRAFT_10707 [Ramicandelaber brevisporus]|nr:hypothetical protein GQ42DRAFT_10707 [Ramicandelaber brevisporus]